MDLYKSESGIIYFENADYLRRVFEQILRDFDMSGVPFKGEDESPQSYTELYTLLQSNITSLINESSSHFKNLLYRIDVSEKKIHQRMLLRNETQLDEVVSKMIIERCLQKVLTREKFS